MNRQKMNNLNFISNLSNSIKLISAVTCLGYLLSFSETAVNVSTIVRNRFSANWTINLNLRMYLDPVGNGYTCLITSNRWHVNTLLLGTFSDSRQPITIDVCNLDSIYLLFPGNTHLWGHHWHRLRDSMSKTHRTAVEPDADICLFCDR